MELTIVIITLVLFISLIVYQVRSEQVWRMDNHGSSVINEKDHYYFLGLYFNRSDKRIFVSKRSGGGFTFNFGNPIGLTLFLLIVAGTVYLLTL